MRISDWSSDVCSSDLERIVKLGILPNRALPDIGEQRSPVELGTLEADIGGDVFRRRIEDRACLELAQFPRDRVEFLRGGYLGRWPRNLRLLCRHRLYAIEPVAEPALLAVKRSAGHTSELPSLIRTSY